MIGQSYMDLYNANKMPRDQAADEAFRNQDYRNYVELVRKPRRVTALLDIRCEFGLDDDVATEFWPLVGEVWQQSENSGTNPARRYWRDIWSYVFDAHSGERTPFSHTVMDEAERAIFDRLPQKLTVWRGYRSDPAGCRDALSWTLSKTVAEWFAARGSEGIAMLAEGTVSKSAILAFLNRCHEAEIVAMPEMVEIVADTAIKVPPIEDLRRPRCEVAIEGTSFTLTHSYPEPFEPVVQSIEGESDAFLDDDDEAA